MPLLKLEEVAYALRVDVTIVRRWCKNGAIKNVALPKRGKRQSYRIESSALDEILGRSSE